MLMSVTDFIESAMECMLTQFSRRKAEGGEKFELRVVPELLCSRCPPMTSSFSPLVGGGAEDTAMEGVTLAGA